MGRWTVRRPWRRADSTSGFAPSTLMTVRTPRAASSRNAASPCGPGPDSTPGAIVWTFSSAGAGGVEQEARKSPRSHARRTITGRRNRRPATSGERNPRERQDDPRRPDQDADRGRAPDHPPDPAGAMLLGAPADESEDPREHRHGQDRGDAEGAQVDERELRGRQREARQDAQQMRRPRRAVDRADQERRRPVMVTLRLRRRTGAADAPESQDDQRDADQDFARLGETLDLEQAAEGEHEGRDGEDASGVAEAPTQPQPPGPGRRPERHHRERREVV